MLAMVGVLGCVSSALLGVSFASASDGTACMPEAGYDHCLAFAEAGSVTTAQLPDGVQRVHALVWGGGGGGAGGSGGGGGFAGGDLDVTADGTIGVIVAHGGHADGTGLGSSPNSGAGGKGTIASGAGGAGLSVAYSGTTNQIMAGGGGGASGGTNNGGAGGGSTGGDGQGASAGHGATPSSDGVAGGNAKGSNGGAGAYGGGGGGLGGGGGAWRIGGGGGGDETSGSGGGGGGSTAGPNGTTAPGSGARPGNTESPLYAAGAGIGGRPGEDGGAGRVVIEWNQSGLGIADMDVIAHMPNGIENFALDNTGHAYATHENGQSWGIVSIDLATGHISEDLAAGLGGVTGLALDGHGHAYVAAAQTLWKVDLAAHTAQTITSDTLGIPIPYLSRMQPDGHGNIIIATHDDAHPLIRLNTATDKAALVGDDLPNTTALAVTTGDSAYSIGGDTNTISTTDLNSGKTITGPELQGFYLVPQALALDSSGAGYSADYFKGTIRKINLTTGESSIFAWAGDIASNNGSIIDVHTDTDGNLYASDQSGNLYRTTL